MNRHEDFCTYDQAVRLKEIGFDWECYEFWSKDFCTDGIPTKIRRTKTEPNVCVMSECNSMLDKIGSDLITAPTLALAQKWLRETKHINVYPEINCLKKWFATAVDMERNEDLIWDRIMFNSYESALSAGIDAVLELVQAK